MNAQDLHKDILGGYSEQGWDSNADIIQIIISIQKSYSIEKNKGPAIGNGFKYNSKYLYVRFEPDKEYFYSMIQTDFS